MINGRGIAQPSVKGGGLQVLLTAAPLYHPTPPTHHQAQH